jgi:hypothetical protein
VVGAAEAAVVAFPASDNTMSDCGFQIYDLVQSEICNHQKFA